MEEQLQPRLLDIPAAAKFLSSTVYSVRTLLWDGQLPFIKLGKRFVIDRLDLEHWIEAEKQKNGP